LFEHISQKGVTVVTPTFQRDKQLASCIQQVKNQKTTVPFNHLVVSDGPNSFVETVCAHFNVRCITIDKEQDQGTGRGHLPRDVGIAAANTDYICLWDDDNIYFDHAIQSLYDTASGFDIGVCPVKYLARDCEPYFKVVPRSWDGSFKLGNIDTMNVIMRTELARKETWSQFKIYEGDFLWLEALQNKHVPSVQYRDTIIGVHL
jgi:glycosyltransferase involved in cell wall biosynthesis